MTQEISTNKKNVPQFRWIRVIACLCIVSFSTVFASNIYFEQIISPEQLKITQTVEHLLMWCVPCFLMVTGALLLDPLKEIPWSKLLGKYMRRIALALVCFTLLFQILDFLMDDNKTVLAGWLSDLLQGHSWAHMWYLYLMIGIYLMIPFYKMITAKASLKQVWLLVGILVLFVSVLPMLSLAGFDCGFYLPTQIIYPVYVFAGYLLYRENMPVWAGALALVLSTAGLVYFSLTGCTADIYGYDSILVVAQAMGFYSLMLHVKLPEFSLLRSLDECGFGIYLIHFIGVKVFMKWIGFDPYMHHPVASIIGMVFFFYLGAYAITYILRKIPKLDLL